MKKMRKAFWAVSAMAIAVAFSAVAVACGDKPNDPKDDPEPEPKPEATLSYLYTIPSGRTEEDVTGKAPNSVTAEVGTVVSLPDKGTLAIEGCLFLGWSDGETVYGVGETITLEADVALQAVWNVGYTGKDGNYAYVEGDKISLKYGGRNMTVPLDGDATEYNFTSGANKYFLKVDHVNKTYIVKTWFTRENEYVLYLPKDGSMNLQRVVSLRDNGLAEILGYGMDEMEVVWAEGTYEPVSGAQGEYLFHLTIDKSSGTITDFRFRLNGKVEREDYIYQTFVMYSEAGAGSFRSESATLELDHYGYAVYTADTAKNGVYEIVEKRGFDDEFVLFTGEDGKQFTFRLDRSQQTFTLVGNEIGSYQVWELAEGAKGKQKIVLDGLGGVTVKYGNYAFSVNMDAATGTYRALGDGEFALTVTNVIEEGVLPEAYSKELKFKFYENNVSGDIEICYVTYNSALAGEYATADGTGALSMDGYGNATYRLNGAVEFSGVCSVTNDLVMVTDADDFRVFQIKEGNVFEEVGEEIGTYFYYHAVNGIDPNKALFFDGDGKVTVYTYDSNSNQLVAGEKGTYTATEKINEWLVSVGGREFTVLLAELDFGTAYEPLVYPVYIEYSEDWAGTYTNGRQTLVLDGYGLNAVYTNTAGNKTEGTFTVEKNLVTLVDSYGDSYMFVLKNGVFEAAGESAGTHYAYNLDAGVYSQKEKLFLDGKSAATYTVGSETKEGTYSLVPGSTDVYEFSAEGVIFRFKLKQAGTVKVFVVYNALWAGEYTQTVEDVTLRLKLDGFGGVEFTDHYGDTETYECTVMGAQGTIVEFTTSYYVTEKYSLDKATNTFVTASKESGYRYFYDGDTVRGKKRLFLDGKGVAELTQYNEGTEVYEAVSNGVYAAVEGKTDVYTYAPSSGEGFTFKVKEVEYYPVYTLSDGLEGEFTYVDASNRTWTFTADGFGSATYEYYDEGRGEMREREGEYSVSGDTVTFTIKSSGYLIFTAVLTIDRTTNTFTVVSQE